MANQINTPTLDDIFDLKSNMENLLSAETTFIQNEVLRICYYGDFKQADIKKLEKKQRVSILSRLIDYYFSLEISSVEAKKNGRKILLNDIGQNQSLVAIDLNNLQNELNAKAIFKRVFQFAMANNYKQKITFTSFYQFEKNRWKNILQYFTILDREYILISIYLNITSTIIAKEIIIDSNKQSSFGIDPSNEINLQKLFYKLTEKINFIHIPVMNKENKLHKEKPAGIKEAVKIISAKDYLKFESVIYFGCPTTIACYILDLLNKKIGNNNQLNGYSIERSQKIKISPSKLKPDQQLLKNFEYLNRAVYAKSLSRIKNYIKNPNSTESKILKQINPILREHQLL